MKGVYYVCGLFIVMDNIIDELRFKFIFLISCWCWVDVNVVDVGFYFVVECDNCYMCGVRGYVEFV